MRSIYFIMSKFRKYKMRQYILTLVEKFRYFILSCTFHQNTGPWLLWSYGSWIYSYICIQCLSPLTWVRISTRARCITCDKGCQWLLTGRWISPGPPVSSTNKTDRHNIYWNIVERGVKHHQTNKQTNYENNINTTLNRCKNMRNPYSYNSQSCIQLSSSGEKENNCLRQFTAYLKSHSD